jgi:carboxyl-terminal processing protease
MIKKISIVRDVVEYGETFAKSTIIKNQKGEKFGLIYLPEFYVNMNDRNGRNASDDVERELNLLKKENIKGLIFDVRDNGGGSLIEAIEIVGKFIEKGPVVQVKTGRGSVDVMEDQDRSISWNGPIVVLVNEFSASASEILAAALQDYQRAVIIGSQKTYGKGTVQTVRALNELFDFSNKDYGAIKLTTQKFYRINGGSTQLKGVSSDIVIPDEYSYTDVSESNKKNALEWDRIDHAKYKNWNNPIPLEKIKLKSSDRLKKEKFSNSMDEKARWIKQMADNKKVPLSILKYKEFLKKNEQKNKYFDSILSYKNSFEFYSKAPSLKDNEAQKLTQAKNEDWYAKLRKDFTLSEAINVLKDLK